MWGISTCPYNVFFDRAIFCSRSVKKNFVSRHVINLINPAHILINMFRHAIYKIIKLQKNTKISKFLQQE